VSRINCDGISVYGGIPTAIGCYNTSITNQIVRDRHRAPFLSNPLGQPKLRQHLRRYGFCTARFRLAERGSPHSSCAKEFRVYNRAGFYTHFTISRSYRLLSDINYVTARDVNPGTEPVSPMWPADRSSVDVR